MITYRTFLNSDPPQLVALWNRQPELPVRLGRITNSLLENQVFAKLYFDPQGFLVAEDDGTIVGFAHCAFGPDESGEDLDRSAGIISQLVVGPEQSPEVAAELVRRSIAYFSEREAGQVFVGSRFPTSPFYQGFYGGTRVPGLARSETVKLDAYLQAGFTETAVVEIWQLQLVGLRSPIDRPLMAARRNFEIRNVNFAEPGTWWEHCRFGDQQHLQFQLVDRKLGTECGNLQFWTTRPIETGWEQSLIGLGSLEMHEPYASEPGVTACFLLDSLKRLAKDGFVQVEAQFDSRDEQVRPLLPKFGFELRSEAVQMMRPVSADDRTKSVAVS